MTRDSAILTRQASALSSVTSVQGLAMNVETSGWQGTARARRVEAEPPGRGRGFGACFRLSLSALFWSPHSEDFGPYVERSLRARHTYRYRTDSL